MLSEKQKNQVANAIYNGICDIVSEIENIIADGQKSNADFHCGSCDWFKEQTDCGRCLWWHEIKHREGTACSVYKHEEDRDDEEN